MWIHSAQESRRARIALSIVLALAVLVPGYLFARTALDLDQQRTGILEVLRDSSIAKNDPAAVQLVNKRTVTANGRDYGGAGLIPNPADLFNEEGTISQTTKQDLAWRMVLSQVPRWMPFVVVQSPTAVVLGTLAVLIALLALVWIGLGGHLVEWGSLAVAVGLLCWALEMPMLLRTVVGIALIALLFSVLWRLLQGALYRQGSTSAVARTTVLEGVRSFAAIGFAAPVAIFLPILALSRDPDQGLYQAIPGFLDWAHTVVYASAALLVIIFGCATTAFEIRDRQVWTVLTKPVSRLGWMAGKWLGTVSLGAVVLVGGGIGIYGGSHYMSAQPPISERDAYEVRNAIMTARVGTGPEMVGLARDRLIEIIDQTIASDGALTADIDAGRKDREMVRRELANTKQKEFLAQQRQIAPGQSRDYTFRGLSGASKSGRQLSLRYEFHAGSDDSHQMYPMIVEFRSGKGAVEGQSPWDMRTWTPGEAYSYEIDPAFVDADGSLKIRIYNAGVDERDAEKRIMPGPLSMYFDASGLEVLYADASFGDNLIRAMIIDLAKIAFLSALAIVSATLLSFPVAVLLSFGIFAMATLTPFLAQSLQYYEPDSSSGVVIYVFQWIIKALASVIEFALSGFAKRAPSDSLAQGRVIGLRDLAETILSIGVLWTGGTILVGWLAARNKEIAVYSGQS
jgi:hypothetical protein